MLEIKTDTCEYVTSETNADAVQTLVSAFIDDPVMNYLFGYDRMDKSDEKKGRIALFFETMTNLHRYLECLVVRNASPQRPEAIGKCIQMWLRPNYNFFTSFWSSPVLGGIRNLSLFSILRTIEVAGKAMWVEHKHVAHIQDVTHHLSFAGTHADFQKQGLLKQVFLPCLDAIDRENGYAYLECTKQENVGLYEHFGFVVVETFEIGFFNTWWLGTGDRPRVTLWGMLRPPAKKDI
jgi:hypothetical protein